MGGLDERGYGDKNEDLELFTPSRSRSGRGRLSLLGGCRGARRTPAARRSGDYYPHMFWMPSGRGLVAGPWTTDTWWFSPLGSTGQAALEGPPQRHAEPRLGHRGAAARRARRLARGRAAGRLGQAQGRLDRAGLATRSPRTASRCSTSATRTPAGTTRPASAAARCTTRARTPTPCCCRTARWSRSAAAGATRRAAARTAPPDQWAAAPFHLTTELWSPRSRTWRLGPPQREFRTYHSTAMLLPDGRVVSAGDDYSGRFTGAEADAQLHPGQRRDLRAALPVRRQRQGAAAEAPVRSRASHLGQVRATCA